MSFLKLRIFLILNTLFVLFSLNCFAQSEKDSLNQKKTDIIILNDSIILNTDSIPNIDSLLLINDSIALQKYSLVNTSDSVVTEKVVSRKILPPQPVVIEDSMRVYYFTESFNKTYLGDLHLVDTMLSFSTFFDPLDDVNIIHHTLTNAGTASKRLNYTMPTDISFDMSIPAFENFLKSAKKIKYYDPYQPYSQVKYTMGGKKEQQLKVCFGRQFLPRFFVSLDFDLLNSPGPYKNNKTNDISLMISARYNTKNERYGATGYYFLNKLDIQENGGIANDSIFTLNIENDRRVVAVNLETAQNTVKTSGFGIGQYFNLSKPKIIYEDDTLVKKSRIPIGRLNYNFDYQRNRILYYDNNPLSAFYNSYDVVMDSLQTNDSTTQFLITNKIEWNTLSYKKFANDIPFYLYIGAEHGYFENRYHSSDTVMVAKKTFNNLSPYAGIIINLFKATRISGEAKIITNGYHSGNFSVHGNWLQYLGTSKKNIGSVFFDVIFKNESASWFYESYASNHFRWENNFDPSICLNLEVGYKHRFFSLGAAQKTIDKYVYLNELAHPDQIGGTVNIREVYANFNIPVWKFSFIGSARYQKSDNEDVLRLPAISSRLKICFTQPLLKGKAILQPGVTIQYFTKYYADAYMPSLHAFYLQNDVKIGNYPFIDVYIAMKIKRANLYVQYSNIYALAGDYNYFSTPHYPMRDNRFYFGINWRLYK